MFDNSNTVPCTTRKSTRNAWKLRNRPSIGIPSCHLLAVAPCKYHYIGQSVPPSNAAVHTSHTVILQHGAAWSTHSHRPGGALALWLAVSQPTTGNRSSIRTVTVPSRVLCFLCWLARSQPERGPATKDLLEDDSPFSHAPSFPSFLLRLPLFFHHSFFLLRLKSPPPPSILP